MSKLLTGRLVRRAAIVVPALAAVLTMGAGCGPDASDGTDTAGAAPDVTSVATERPTSPPDDAPTTTKPPVKPPATSAPAAASWPSPEDCVSYNPATLKVRYEAGVYSIEDGSKVVMRLAGGPGETVGDKGLALAQRYRKHCFLGRDNAREEPELYVFDYWRNASGQTPPIPGQDEDCSPYDKTNLTVEDMGDGHGWRVKEHDHVLHLFDNQADARNGKLVLAKYRQICMIGDYLSYSR